MSSLREIAMSVEPFVLNARHELHAHPETRWETFWTMGYIEGKVRSMGFEPRHIDGGIVVDIDAVPGATERILFRADFDAMPVPEETGLPFASQVVGKSHACGHDVGTAILLGFLLAVASNKVHLTRNIRVLFQDAEENPGTSPRLESGGEVCVKEGVCDGVSRAYALHIWNHPGSESGVFLSRPGAMLGNSGRINFKVKCSGGHVAMPHTGANALRVCNEIINQLSSFGARHFDPTQPMALEPAVLNSGKGTNVMPAEADMWYGFRTMLSRSEHISMAKLIEMEVRLVATTFGAEITDVKLVHGHPVLINNEVIYADMKDLLEANGEKVVKMKPLLGGEDFAHIAMAVPSAMFMLGAYTQDSGDHHSPTFNPDEKEFWRGVHFWLSLATAS
ncbi:MAG: M20 family metallopeptidase [Candidatus Staskawiczbacteria bacterium]